MGPVGTPAKWRGMHGRHFRKIELRIIDRTIKLHAYSLCGQRFDILVRFLSRCKPGWRGIPADLELGGGREKAWLTYDETAWQNERQGEATT